VTTSISTLKYTYLYLQRCRSWAPHSAACS